MKLFNKLKKLISYSFALTVALAAADQAQAQGAGSAIRFTGAATSSANLSDSLSQALSQSDFTIEMWIKVRSNASDPVFIGNKNWASGANTGFLWCRYAANTLRFNFRANGRTRKDYNMTLDYAKWNHIAITVKRNGSITGYVNGRLNGTPINIAADSGYALHANFPLRLGADGNNAYTIDGDMDEVRIWNTIRTEADIRNNMCQKISGAESGLMAYYRLDETSGNTLTNSASASTGFFDGSFAGAPVRIASGAAIGDAAVNLYATSFAGQSLNLTSAANGNIQLSGISDSMYGVHIFKVNAAPNTTAGIPNPGSNNVYYGIFPVNDTASYTLAYDYTNFPAAISNEGGIDLFNRYSTDATWTLWGALKNTTANTLTKTAAKGRNDLVMGSFVPSVTCNIPTALNAQNISANGATLGWTTGGSNTWNLSYGTGAFTPGAGGTTLHNLSTAATALTGLTANTTYRFYVQDSCAALNSSSAWAGPYSFTTAMDYSSFGSGYAMNFQGTAANEHVNLGDSLSGAIAKTNFTIETWIRFNNPSSDPSFIGNKDWASGQNTGILWCWNGGNSLRFNFKPAGGTRRDYDMTVPDPSAWNHIAMVVDRSGMLTAYLNGIQAGTPINIAADSGRSLDGVLPLRIGQDGTGVYGPKFKGAMDELKIWNKALTVNELRQHICQKVNGNDTNLIAYYRMDETAGNVLTNLAQASGAVFNGVLMNNPQRIISGAAIGDTSINNYPTDWTGISLSLGSNAQGSITIDSIAADALGMHVYRINNAPNFTNGIVQPGSTNNHFGVFIPGNKNAAYKMSYNYSAYPAAVANNAQLHIYNRGSNADMTWIQTPAQNNTTTNTIGLSPAAAVKQYILADFSAAACPTPANISTTGIDTGKATINWTSTAAGHIIEYGNNGFVPGTGTTVSAIGASLTLNNLDAAQTYTFYIKDSCSATSSSAWVGPFIFTTLNPCPLPVNITADSITDASMVIKWVDNGMVTQDYIVSWGVQGFGNPAFGIQTNVNEKRFELTGASANTAYDFYVRTNCNSSVSNSGWAGPFTFSTLACNVATGVSTTQITSTGAKASWTGTSGHWNLEYGAAGFNRGTGTPVSNLTAAGYTFSNLAANTAYDFYLQDSCTVGINPWKGPYSFRTIQPTAIDKTAGSLAFGLYPNPAQDQVTVQLPASGEATTIIIRNNLGSIVYEAITRNATTAISTSQLTSGIYFISLSQGQSSGNRKIAVQH